MIDTYVSHSHYYAHLEPIVEATGSRVIAVRAEWSRERGWPATVEDMTGHVLVAGYQDTLAVSRRGRRPILLEHGSGQTYADARYHPSYPGGQHRESIGLFLCTNDGVAAANAEAYPDIPCAVIGSPRLDVLERRRRDDREQSEVGRPVLGIGWHWPCRVSRESGWAFPEWYGALERVVAEWRGPVLGTSHPRSLLNAARWYERLGVEVVPEWADMVGRVDVMSVDNSSILFEAAALGIPVVLVNSAKWRRDVDHGLRFWEWSEIGPNVWPCGNVDTDAGRWLDAIWEAYDEAFRFDGYCSDMVEVLYPHRGKAVEVAVDALETYLAQT